MIDREVGPYWVLEQLAQGPWGTACKGVHKTREQEVAIFQLAPTAFPDAAARDRFVREATFLRSAAPRRVATIFLCLKEGDDSVLLVTEYLPVTLEEQLRKEGTLPEETAAAYCLTLLDAVHYLHRYQIVHGRIGPSSVLFAPDGTLKLGFFGPATLKGTGTPDLFRPPEDVAEEVATAASDLYAVGALLGRMVGVEPLFPAPSDPTAESGISSPLRRILARALATDPRERFATTKKFAERLQIVVDATTHDSPRARLAAAVLRYRETAILVLVGLLIFSFLAALQREEGKVPRGERVKVAPPPPVGTEIPPAPSPALPSQPPAPKPVKAAVDGAEERAAAHPAAAKKKKHRPAHKKKKRRVPVPQVKETTVLVPTSGELSQGTEIEPWSIRK